MEEGIGTSSWDVGPFEGSDGGETYINIISILLFTSTYIFSGNMRRSWNTTTGSSGIFHQLDGTGRKPRPKQSKCSSIT